MTYKEIYTTMYKLTITVCNKLKRKRKTIACLFLFSGVVLSTLKILNLYLEPDLYFLYWGPWENTSCHYIETDVTLPRADRKDFNPPARSIFFHETSCRGQLNSRQACTVESAARANPDWQINVLFAGPVTHHALKTGAISVIKNITNIKLIRVHIAKYGKGTPLESMLAGGALNKTRWRISHSSDVLRYLSLYKFGGVYLDLDMVVIKSFDSLARNWVARAAEVWVESAAMCFSRDEIGREVADAAIRDLKSEYRGDVWGHNGPGVITRVLKKRCLGVAPTAMSAATCNGFEVYRPEFIYPINFLNASIYFEPGDVDEEITYLHHVWNKLTGHLTVHPDSRYAKLARKYCPNVYKLYEIDFGL